MKPILNKEMILEFIEEEREATKNLDSTTIQDTAIKVGRTEILIALLTLVEKAI